MIGQLEVGIRKERGVKVGEIKDAMFFFLFTK